MSDKSFNRKHPEIQDGEMFLTNVGSYSEMRFAMEDDGFTAIGWKTKRQGVIAYDIYGKPVHGMVPVFVQRKELEKAGIDPNSLWTNERVNYQIIIAWVVVVIVILIIIAFAISKYL